MGLLPAVSNMDSTFYGLQNGISCSNNLNNSSTSQSCRCSEMSDLSDLDLEIAYQNIRDQYDQPFDTVDDFLEFLCSQLGRNEQVRDSRCESDLCRSIQTVKAYIGRRPRKRKLSSPDTFRSDTSAHRDGRFSRYSSDRESPPRKASISASPMLSNNPFRAPWNTRRDGLESSQRPQSCPPPVALQPPSTFGQTEPPETSRSEYALFTIETDQGPVQVPVNMQKMVDEKRKRIVGASTGYIGGLARRPQKERELSRQIAILESKIRVLVEEKEYYRKERDYFRGVVYNMPVQQFPLRLPSPPLRKRGSTDTRMN